MTLDELFDLDPLKMNRENIDELIAAQRAHRQRIASGEKVKKEKGPQEKLSMEQLGFKVAAPVSAVPKVIRRI